MSTGDEYDWPPGWCALLPEQAPVFLEQLRRELGPDHPLQSLPVRAIGVALGNDDAVFAVDGWQAPFFVAHLSWRGPDPRPWLSRWLRPWPQDDPAVAPLAALSALARDR